MKTKATRQAHTIEIYNLISCENSLAMGKKIGENLSTFNMISVFVYLFIKTFILLYLNKN